MKCPHVSSATWLIVQQHIKKQQERHKTLKYWLYVGVYNTDKIVIIPIEN